MTHRFQPAILEAVPLLARHLELDLRPGADVRSAVARLRDSAPLEKMAVGIGEPLALALGARIRGLRAFPSISGPGCSFPATQRALWAFLASNDASELHDRIRSLGALLDTVFVVREEVSCFRYREGRDLTGYEDGTENPKGEFAVEAAILSGAGPGLDGSSFVAVQRWVHDLDAFSKIAPEGRDAVIGRRLSTNEEIADAPAFAHVKRAAQESYDPPAFMVRRSMPWGGIHEHGLYFVAFGQSLDRFERVLRRMSGADDGIVDGLMTFSRPISGAYYWCPPLDAAGRIDLSAIGI